MRIRLSILDLAPIARGQSARESFAASVALARRAEELGYQRVWYAEHHNMPSIASSATSVLIAHIGAQTTSIRLGSGGIMLPNHSPLVIAEQFGTLEAMYPGRIDLGLGRAPGSDQQTTYALRRDPRSAEAFPRDVLELQAYLAGDSRVPGVDAVPGKGARVPLYILGSSLFGAQPGRRVRAAVRVRLALRARCPRCTRSRPTAASSSRPRSWNAPYVIAGVNVTAADTDEARPGAVRGGAAGAGGEPVRRGASGAAGGDHRRAGRRAAGRRGGGARRPDAQLLRGRHAGRGRRLPRCLPGRPGRTS